MSLRLTTKGDQAPRNINGTSAGETRVWMKTQCRGGDVRLELLSVNLTVPVKLMSAVLSSMKEHGGGSIVNAASYASVSGAAAGIAYTASKHGLLGATKNVAWRFYKEGIRCNAVAPGGMYKQECTVLC